jgi:hypothetical protein
MVVGMHRSGTSFLTGSLQLAGLELGKHSTWNPFNTKGNRENADFMHFHDAVLKARGGDWKDPPAEPVVWTAEETARARELVEGFAGMGRWGFKDPRALLMVDAWKALVPDLEFVGIFRHPVAVARSIAGRGGAKGMPAERAFALWTHYNRILIALHDRYDFPLLCFDDEPALLHRKLNRVLVELGLQPLAGERFYAEELQHHRSAQDELPAALAPLYHELRQRAR